MHNFRRVKETPPRIIIFKQWKKGGFKTSRDLYLVKKNVTNDTTEDKKNAYPCQNKHLL